MDKSGPTRDESTIQRIYLTKSTIGETSVRLRGRGRARPPLCVRPPENVTQVQVYHSYHNHS